MRQIFLTRAFLDILSPDVFGSDFYQDDYDGLMCGLPLLPMKEKYPVNFSGNWMFNEEKGELNGKARNDGSWKTVVKF